MLQPQRQLVGVAATGAGELGGDRSGARRRQFRQQQLRSLDVVEGES